MDTANITDIRAGAPDAADATVTFKLWSDNGCTVQVGTDREETISAPASRPASSACGTETTTISFDQPAP